MLAGLDLGRVKDPSALVLVKRSGGIYEIRSCATMRPDEDFLDIVPWINQSGAQALAFDVTGLLSKPHIADKHIQELIVRRATMPVFPILATMGRLASRVANQKGTTRNGQFVQDWTVYVPKRQLVENYSNLAKVERRVAYRTDAPGIAQLGVAMGNYGELAMPGGGVTWGAKDQSAECHDDLVSALQLALWLGENGGRFVPANRRHA